MSDLPKTTPLCRDCGERPAYPCSERCLECRKARKKQQRADFQNRHRAELNAGYTRRYRAKACDGYEPKRPANAPLPAEFVVKFNIERMRLRLQAQETIGIRLEPAKKPFSTHPILADYADDDKRDRIHAVNPAVCCSACCRKLDANGRCKCGGTP